MLSLTECDERVQTIAVRQPRVSCSVIAAGCVPGCTGEPGNRGGRCGALRQSSLGGDIRVCGLVADRGPGRGRVYPGTLAAPNDATRLGWPKSNLPGWGIRAPAARWDSEGASGILRRVQDWGA